mgnify:CR=1 FL=1
MKNKKLFLELDDDEPMNIGLIRLTKKAPNYEVFFEINKLNSFQFYRTDDLIAEEFSFSKFETYLPETKTYYHVLANKSAPLKQKTTDELFSQTEEIKFLLPKNKDVEYIIYAKDSFPDFSLLLLPENILQPIQDYSLQPQNELYKLIQYYE